LKKDQPERSTTASPNHGIETFAVADTALALRGAPYRNGGSDPTGFDCSGFVQYVFAQHGIALPRDVKAQFEVGDLVSLDELELGDLVFFTTVAPGASHVGLSLGGDEFVHAPSSKGVVRVERISAAYWSRRVIGARRLRN
jgi:peptidoglycan DL-endopeptidase CwlO